MSKNILLHLEIPLDNGELPTGIYFNRWIPEKDSAIEFEHENYKFRLWVEEDCIFSIGEVDIPKHVNINVIKFKIEIELNDIEDDLANFIYNERDCKQGTHHGINPSEDGYDELNEKFIEISKDILILAYNVTNRVISYVRNEKSQYLLNTLVDDKMGLNGMLVHTRAKAKINDGEWFRWSPNHNHIHIINIGSDEEYVTEEDWAKIDSFVNSKARTNLSRELISNAKSLLSNGLRRSAVIEATTGLEVALNNFAEKPNYEKLELPVVLGRIDTERLHKQVEHLGFSASMRYLIPILFKEDILKTDVLNQCHNAIAVRNNIVHKGQRDVKENNAEAYVNNITKCTEILIEYTKE